MRKLLVILTFALPLLLAVAGVYIVTLTPDVMTTTTEYHSSHETGLAMLLMGGLFGLIASIFVAMMMEDWR